MHRPWTGPGSCGSTPFRRTPHHREDSMTRENIQAAADALFRARTTGHPIAPVSETYGIRDVATAYAVAALNSRRRQAAGARTGGWKVGLAPRAVQQQLGVDQPDFGVLTRDMGYLNGDAVPAGRLM